MMIGIQRSARAHLSAVRAVAILALVTTAPFVGAQPAVDATSRTFVTKAAIGGMAEVEMGRLASTKASNAEVRAFGEQMVADHQKANESLEEVAAKKGIEPPSALDREHQEAVEVLRKKSDADFDRAYIAEQVKGHEAMRALLASEATSGTDPDLRDFAKQTLPTVEAHRAHAKALAKTLAAK